MGSRIAAILWLLPLVFLANAAAEDFDDLADLVAAVEPAVVRITTFRGEERLGVGSGFVIDAVGFVATNFHVVQSCTKAEVEFADGTSIQVRGFVAAEPNRDIAILQLVGFGLSLPALDLANAPPRKGAETVALGAPLNLPFTASNGIVSSVRRAEEDSRLMREFDLDPELVLVQTTAPISRGNSGGPLVDLEGKVIGINTFSYAVGQNLNYAVSAGDVADVFESKEDAPIALWMLPTSKARLPSMPDVPDKPSPAKRPSGDPSDFYEFATVSGRQITPEEFEFDEDQISRLFPEDGLVASSKFPDGKLQSAFTVDPRSGRLDGFSAALSESGFLMTVAPYRMAKRHGTLRRWTDSGQMLFMCEYKAGRKDGLAVFFRDGAPWLVQEYENAVLSDATLVLFNRRFDQPPEIVDADRVTDRHRDTVADALATLKDFESEMAAEEAEVKRQVYKWYKAEKKKHDRALRTALAPVKRERARLRRRAIEDARNSVMQGIKDAAYRRSGF